MIYNFKSLLRTPSFKESITFQRMLNHNLRVIELIRAHACGTNGTVDANTLFPDLLPYYEAMDRIRVVPTSVILTGTNPDSGKSIEVFYRTTPSVDLQADLFNRWVYTGKMVYWEEGGRPEKRLKVPFGETAADLHLVANLGSFESYEMRR